MKHKGLFFPRNWLLTVGDDDPNNPGGGGGADKTLVTLQERISKAEGGAITVAAELHSENNRLRLELDGLKKKIPAEGSLVLSKDDAATWEAIKALNLTAQQIADKVKLADNAAGELAGLKRKDVIREIAELEGFNAAVLTDILPTDAPLESREVEESGKKIKRSFIKVKEGGADKEYSLTDWVNANKRDFLPALKKQTDDTTDDGNRFVQQDVHGKPADPKDPVKERLEAREASRKANPNPLMPKAAAQA
jgi:hypothetical protein